MKKTEKKDYLVVGLGQYGMTVAKTLAQEGCSVIAVDKMKEKIQDIAPYVEYAAAADTTDANVLSTMGLDNVETAIIAITDNMEASILTTINLKDMGIPHIIVKAMSEVHQKIALKLGANSVVFPEKEMGELTARNLVSRSFVDLVSLSGTISIVEMRVPDDWVGKSLIDLNLRTEYDVNVIAVREGDNLRVSIKPNKKLEAGQVLVMLGPNDSFARMKA